MPPQGQFAPPQQQFAPPQQQFAPVDPQAQAAAAAMAGQQYRDGLLAQCAQGIHQRTTSYGMVGIIMAIACFPCGLIALFLDVENKCARCGVNLP